LTKNTNIKSDSEILRQKAEELLKKKSPATVSTLSEADTLKLIHELEVHQFELVIQNETLLFHQVEVEMQNKELSSAKEKAETDAMKYAELYDFAPSGYFTLSNEGTITEVNFSGAIMLGKDRSQLKDNRFGFFVSNATKPIFNLFLDKVFSSKANESCDVTLSTRGNVPMYVHLTGVAIENGGQCIVTMVDITDSRIMTALQQSEQRYRALVEWSPYSVVIHTDWKIVYVNPAAIKMFGAESEQDLVGTNVLDRVHPDCHQIVKERIREGIDDGINAPITELKYIRLGGTVFDAEVHGIPITYNGVPCILAAMSDITERKQLTEKLELYNQQLVKLHLEKDKFLSIIAHDLRAPFHVFLGFSNMLVDDLDTLTLKETRKIAGLMKNSATNLFHLLENLLEWSRLQRGINTFQPATFLLMPMISEIMHPVVDSANNKGIRIIYAIPDDLEVFADEYMLASIIRNLVTNAVKFTFKGGEVTIAAKTVPGNSVEFSVTDTGIGMGPEMVNDLFRLDVQTKSRGTEGEPSTGLGLVICKDFIEKHGGNLWVESEKGKGSVFYCTIPCHSAIMLTIMS